jgi:hypothetical protein
VLYPSGEIQVVMCVSYLTLSSLSLSLCVCVCVSSAVRASPDHLTSLVMLWRMLTFFIDVLSNTNYSAHSTLAS